MLYAILYIFIHFIFFLVFTVSLLSHQTFSSSLLSPFKVFFMSVFSDLGTLDPMRSEKPQILNCSNQLFSSTLKLYSNHRICAPNSYHWSKLGFCVLKIFLWASQIGSHPLQLLIDRGLWLHFANQLLLG